ncbi:MAG: FtsX-like permease family protein [Candidatus Bathyarchaeia archaeon]
MFGYAAKRIVRGRGMFLAFFLSVALAAILFSGILQGADAVGVSLLNNVLEATEVDIVSTAQDKNLTRTRVYEIEEIFGAVEGVKGVEHFVRWEVLVNVSGWDEWKTFMVVALPENSTLMEGLTGVEELEEGMIYIDMASVNASDFVAGEEVTLKVDTYQPYNPPGFEMRTYNFEIGGAVVLDDRAFAILSGRYRLFLRSVLLGTGGAGRRPEYRLIIMSEETLRSILDPLYASLRRSTKNVYGVALVSLDRERLVNPWDIPASSARVKRILEEVNSLGAEYMYVPVNYLGELLKAVESHSAEMKRSTMVVAAPVFFTAWYLGVTVSNVSLGLRRREIGLLFTRGMTHRQVLYIFIFEAVLVSLLAGGAGIIVGAAMLPFVIPGMGLLQAFRSVSPFTVGASLAFTSALALLAVYKPAKRAAEMDVASALLEYQGEEPLGSWHEPLLAVVLGAYRIAMLMLGLSVESFRPESPSLGVFILYSTWWGVDYILSYIAPILFFWGFINLLLQYVSWFHDLLERLAELLVGDVARFSWLSARRNLRRTVASTFMAALIVGYGVIVIGNVASTDDFMDRWVKTTIGADASVWLFEGRGAEALASEIAGLEGVASATVETWFSPGSSLGEVPVRAIEPLRWRETAYVEEGWIEGDDVFERMNASDVAAIMEKDAADRLGVKINGTMIVKLGHKTFTLKIVGFFGLDPGENWALHPVLYVPDSFLAKVKEKYITQRRILVRLEEGADAEAVEEAVLALDPDVERVDVAEAHLRRALTNVYLVGPRRVEELGVYLAALVSSVGVALIVSTALRVRWKELTIMAIRGFSAGQLAATLLVENIGMTAFAIALGFAVGLISLRGETEIFNAAASAALERRVVLPPSTLLSLAVVAGLVIVSTVVPILLAARRVSNNPIWRIEE